MNGEDILAEKRDWALCPHRVKCEMKRSNKRQFATVEVVAVTLQSVILASKFCVSLPSRERKAQDGSTDGKFACVFGRSQEMRTCARACVRPR